MLFPPSTTFSPARATFPEEANLGAADGGSGDRGSLSSCASTATTDWVAESFERVCETDCPLRPNEGQPTRRKSKLRPSESIKFRTNLSSSSRDIYLMKSML